MMRLALIADIHGNLEALDAVLAEIEREGVERVVCLGDVAIGPQPVETLERVRAIGCPVTMGNWDSWFVHGMPRHDGWLGSILADLRSWSVEQLSPDHRRYLGAFVPTVEVELPDGRALLAFHGSPRSFEDSILATTPERELELMLDGRTAAVLAGGHTHFQLFRRLGESVLLNPGSVGLPFRRPQAGVMQIAPWAEYALLEQDGTRLSIDLRRTPYDVAAFLRTMHASGMPNADWWAGLWTADSPVTAELSRARGSSAGKRL
jgi:predicted phosphodiesterase